MNVAQHIQPGRKVRYLVKAIDIAKFKDIAVRCGNCANLGPASHNLEHSVGWCTEKHFRTGTATPLLCESWVKA